MPENTRSSAAEIRASFLDFFRARDHRIVPSAPVFPKDDPTLLFTNAGMNQFKDVFLGTGTRDYARAADTQKCIRVSGKHNDLEEVGRDGYHHTFFEMLGNWSFGDYFKREAIAWAWEYLTGTCALPKARLWVTTFGGDEDLGLPADEESVDLWRSGTDIAPDHILRFGAKQNFWEMGETGPCGPCSEIHMDRGPAGADPRDGRDPAVGVNSGSERFLELWNLVFIQFNRAPGGKLHKLPARHVDTGMSLERLVAVMAGKQSNYDIDLFVPIIASMEKASGVRYAGSMEERDVAFRVIADHARALCVAISDGVLPDKTGRGYVLRRLLRRAARFGRQALEMKEPFIHDLVPTVVSTLNDAFPDLRERQDHVRIVLESEERAFGETLDRGLVIFHDLASKLKRSGSSTIPGEQSYELYATYGFPRDLVDLMAREQGLAVDETGWQAAEGAHRSASKGRGTGTFPVPPAELEGVPASISTYHTESRQERTGGAARVLKLIEGKAAILDRTPFYAEGGGQIGDAGWITAAGFRFRVDDTQRMGEIIVHLGELVEGDPGRIPSPVSAEVDEPRRQKIMANHTATHLLHWALKQVLGPNANQQGSLVAPDRLRFDLTHPRAITADEIERIEQLVNEKVVDDHHLVTTVENLEDAKRRGVTALFGEKYAQRVRVVDIGGFSRELCGGTHCVASGQIGAFIIASESAVQAGVRRIEAITRDQAVRYAQKQRTVLAEAAHILKAPEADLVRHIQSLQGKVQERKKDAARDSKADIQQLLKAAVEEGESVNGTLLVVRKLEALTPEDLARLCDAFRARTGSMCGVIGLAAEGKAVLAVFATKDLTPHKVHAGELVKKLSKTIGGGGGGRPDFAQAGGSQPENLDTALSEGRRILREALGAAG